MSSSNSGRTSTGTGSTRRYDPLVLSADDHNHCFSSPASSTNVSAFILSLAIVTNTFGAPAMAVSGGGLDYANIDITGQVGCCVRIYHCETIDGLRFFHHFFIT